MPNKREVFREAFDGFTFIGSTTVYAFMQATGLVNDHITECLVHKELVNGQFPDGNQLN